MFKNGKAGVTDLTARRGLCTCVFVGDTGTDDGDIDVDLIARKELCASCVVGDTGPVDTDKGRFFRRIDDNDRRKLLNPPENVSNVVSVIL